MPAALQLAGAALALRACWAAYPPAPPPTPYPYREHYPEGPEGYWSTTYPTSDTAVEICRNHHTPMGPFHAGQRFRSMRGLVTGVCQSGRNPNIVGICGEPGTGHDNYGACESGEKRRPGFCGARSLWFLRCDQLRPMPDVRFPMTTTLAPPGPPPPGYSVSTGAPRTHGPLGPHCGCAWSPQQGCVVSTRQLVESFSKSSLLGAYCSDEYSEECMLRKNIARTTEEFPSCLDMGPRDCRDSPLCQWNAQGDNACGIDEEQAVLRIVGPQFRGHPLVETIMMHDHCSKQTHETCDAEDACLMAYSMGGRRCDVKPSWIVREMLEYPKLMIDTKLAQAEATCRAHQLETHGFKAKCTGICRMIDGVCRMDPREIERAPIPPLGAMLDMMCNQAFHAEHKCPAPCEEHYQHGHQPCRGPERYHSRSFTLRADQHDRASDHIVKVFTVLMSSTMLYQHRCDDLGHYGSNMCHAASQVCDVEKHDFAKHHGPHFADFAKNRTAMAGSPGFKGIFKRATQAIAEGRAEHFLEDYFENNPEALGNMTKKAVDMFANFFKSSNTEAKEPAIVAPEPSPVLEPSPSHMVNEGPAEPHPRRLGRAAPILVGLGGVIIATVCAGVACGALCHARILGTSARQPLLLSAPQGAGAAALDQELGTRGQSYTPAAPPVPAANEAPEAAHDAE